jgi:translocation and assembly module TamB
MASRALVRVAASGALAGVFSIAALGGVVLHLRLAPGRRLAATTVTAALDRTFLGRLVIEKIGSIDSDGFDGGEASVFDPEGRRVLAVTGLRARASLARIAFALVRGGGDIALVISRARVEHADVTLIPDEDGVPSLARAFLPRPRPGPARTTAPPKVAVWIPEVELRTACVRGQIEGVGNVDVDVANVGGFVLAGTERSSIHVKRYSVSLVAPVKAQGTADTRIEIPSTSGKKVSVWAAFDGDVGDVQIDARGELDGTDVKLTADAVHAEPDAVRALFADWPVQKEVDLHLEAGGRPPLLDIRGHADVGDGAVDVVGDLKLSGGIVFDAAVDARNVDLRTFDAKAPEAAVSAAGRVQVGWSSGQPIQGAFDATTRPMRILGIDAPSAKIDGKIDGAHVSGKAAIVDKAMSSDVDFDVHRGAQGPVVVDLGWTAKVPELERVAWLAPIGSGQAKWRARGQIAGGKLDARVDADVSGFTRAGVRLDSAHVAGSLRGPLDRPEISASLDGKGLAAGPLFFPDVKAEAQGPLARLRVTSTGRGGDAPEVTVGATIERAEGGASLRDVELEAKRGDIALAGKVKKLAVSQGTVKLEDIALSGAGATMTASVDVSPTELHVRASADDVDLKKITSVVAPGLPVAGRLSFAVDADFKGGTERGHARVQLSEATLAGFSGISAQAEADVAGRRFSGGAEVRAGELGTLSARTVDAALVGSTLKKASWVNASGRLEVDTQVDLDRLIKTPFALFAPSVDAGGHLYGKLVLSREELDVHQKHAPSATEAPSPEVDLILWTDQLRLAERGAMVFGLKRPPTLSSQGVDAQLGLHLEAESQQGSLTARLIDSEGLFAGLTAIVDVPLAELLRHPEELGSRLLDLPITAKLVAPARDVDKYPALIRPPDTQGQVEMTGSLTGTIRKPSLSVAVRGRGIKPTSQVVAFPVDVDAQGAYDGRKASARVRATRPEGVVLDARTEVAVSLDPLLSPDSKDIGRWEASGSAKLSDFPLASVSSLLGGQLDGLASGTLRWDGINRDPDVQGQIDVKNLQVDRASFPHAVGVVRIAKGGVVASAGLDQAAGGGSATATARVKWASPLVPTIDPKEPLDVYVSAKDLRAAVLYPVLFRGIFTYFDGRLNGTLHYHQDAAKGDLAQSVDGTFDLRDGLFQIPEVGQEFRNASATISVTKRGEVDVSNVSANGSSGRLTASGKMTLKGLSFVSGEGEVRVAKNETVPLTLEGVPLGEAYGTLLLHAKMADERTVKLDVDVPVFQTDLPASSARDVQKLDDRPDIRVGVRGQDGLSPVLLGAPKNHRSEDALAWKVTFFLGQDVKVSRGRDVEIVLGGEPIVELSDEVRVSGEVDLRSGRVEVFGKPFEIERGVAKFDGDAAVDPAISVVARWEAPDGTLVFVNISGKFKAPVVSLRSEPARSNSEIVALMLFGAPDDLGSSSSTGQEGFGQQAKNSETGEWVLGGAAVTTNVNKVLSSVSPLDISTRVTSDAQSPTPEVAIRLSPKLTAEISYRTRAPAPFESQDRTFVTLDWRFRRNWSIATTLGQQTTVLDLIWRYRY